MVGQPARLVSTVLVIWAATLRCNSDAQEITLEAAAIQINAMDIGVQAAELQIFLDSSRVDELAKILREGSYQPVFTNHAGMQQFVINRGLPGADNAVIDFRLPDSIRVRHQQQIAAVMDEIREHCQPTYAQLEKLDFASVATLRQLDHRVSQLANTRILAGDAQLLSSLQTAIVQVNRQVSLGALAPDSLFRKMLTRVLGEDQLSALRWVYSQPLLKILEDHEILVTAVQQEKLKTLIMNTAVCPFALRNNYGRQYANLMQSDSGDLAQIFSRTQLERLEERGRTDYRITLSR